MSGGQYDVYALAPGSYWTQDYNRKCYQVQSGLTVLLMRYPTTLTVTLIDDCGAGDGRYKWQIQVVCGDSRATAACYCRPCSHLTVVLTLSVLHCTSFCTVLQDGHMVLAVAYGIPWLVLFCFGVPVASAWLLTRWGGTRCWGAGC